MSFPDLSSVADVEDGKGLSQGKEKCAATEQITTFIFNFDIYLEFH